MGCTDRESNFQTTKFRDGKWWASLGHSPTWEGPVNQLKEDYFPELAEPQFMKGNLVYSVERTSDDTALVKPIGRITLLNS